MSKHILWEDIEGESELSFTDWLENRLNDIVSEGVLPLFFTLPAPLYEYMRYETDGCTRILDYMPVFSSGAKIDNLQPGNDSLRASWVTPDQTAVEMQQQLDRHLKDMQPMFLGEIVTAMYLGFVSSPSGRRVPVLRKFDLESGVTVFLTYSEDEIREFDEMDDITDAPDVTEN